MATTQKAAVGRWRFTVDDYYRMTDAGILAEDDRVELIQGEIVQMAALGACHAGSVNKLDDFLRRGIPDGTAIISVQNPLRLGGYLEPQADLLVLRYREDYYSRRHPTPADVLLLIEVSDTSLAYDRGVKLPLYARAGIPEVWIANLVDDIIERYTEPGADDYRAVAQFGHADTIRSVTLPSIALAVDDGLG